MSKWFIYKCLKMCINVLKPKLMRSNYLFCWPPVQNPHTYIWGAKFLSFLLNNFLLSIFEWEAVEGSCPCDWCISRPAGVSTNVWAHYALLLKLPTSKSSGWQLHDKQHFQWQGLQDGGIGHIKLEWKGVKSRSSAGSGLWWLSTLPRDLRGDYDVALEVANNVISSRNSPSHSPPFLWHCFQHFSTSSWVRWIFSFPNSRWIELQNSRNNAREKRTKSSKRAYTQLPVY